MKSESGCESEIGRLSSSGSWPGDDGGHRVPGAGAHRRGVAEPVRVVGQRGEVREQLAIDPPVGVQQRRQGQLVEHDHHHGGRRRPTSTARHGLLGLEEAGGGRRGQEEEQEAEGRQGREGEPQLHGREPRVGDAAAPTPSSDRAEHERDAVGQRAGRLQTNTATSADDEARGAPRRAGRAPSTSPTSASPRATGRSGGQERDRQPEQHDLRRLRRPGSANCSTPRPKTSSSGCVSAKPHRANSSTKARNRGRPVRSSSAVSVPGSPVGSGIDPVDVAIAAGQRRVDARSSSTGP